MPSGLWSHFPIPPDHLHTVQHRRPETTTSRLSMFVTPPHITRASREAQQRQLEKDKQYERRTTTKESHDGHRTPPHRGHTHRDWGSRGHQLKEAAECPDEGKDQIQHDSDSVHQWGSTDRGLDRAQWGQGEYSSSRLFINNPWYSCTLSLLFFHLYLLFWHSGTSHITYGIMFHLTTVLAGVDRDRSYAGTPTGTSNKRGTLDMTNSCG